MNMTLQDFVQQERQRAIDFHEWWLQCHQINPDTFPLKMPEVSWDERYKLWEENG